MITLLILHSSAFIWIMYNFHKLSKFIAYHYSMVLGIIISLWNTLAVGLLLHQILSAYLLYMIILITMAVGAATSMLIGLILDFQSFYAGSMTGIMGGLMGPMLSDILSGSQPVYLFIIVEFTCLILLTISLYSTQIRREI